MSFQSNKQDGGRAATEDAQAPPSPVTTAPAPEPPRPTIGRGLVLLMSFATGIVVANLYYIQPLMGRIAREFGVPEPTVGYAVTLGQAGLAVGTLSLLPLGDVTDRRRMITISCLMVAVSLLLMAFAPNVWVFLAANFLVGVSSIATHLQVSYAAHLAEPARRGRVVGSIMSGLLVGILVARTVSGYGGMYVSWRVVLTVAATVMLCLGALLRWRLPRDDENHTISYFSLLSSMPRLFWSQPVLRNGCIFGALTFAAFNGFWATLTFHLEDDPFRMTPQGIGVFSLVAVAGALAANGAGRLIGVMHPMSIIAWSLLLTLFSFGVFWFGGWTIAGMVVGIVLMDLGIQATHISNQTMIHALMPQARNRIHCIYMTWYFVGGSLGSAAGTWSYSHWGWHGLCAAGMAFIALALAYWTLNRKRRHPLIPTT